MPELERWVLHRLAELDALVRRDVGSYDFHSMFTALHNFCAVDLSAFYFDVRKDALYCDPSGAARRRAVRTVLDRVFDCLTALAGAGALLHRRGSLARAPWRCARQQRPSARLIPEVPRDWRDDALADKWSRIRDLRRVVTGALELERAAKAHRLQPAGGGRGLCATAAYARRRLPASISPRSASRRPAPSSGSAPPADAFTLPDVPGVAVVVGAGAGREMPALLARSARGRVAGGASRALLPLRRCRDGGLMLGRGLIVAAITAVADQLSKIAVLHHFGDPLPPASDGPEHPGALFNLVLTWNYGVSFGLFNNRSPVYTVIFTIVAAAIIVGLLVWLRRVRQTLLALAIGLIIGGAVGNIIDRQWHGAVVDFLDFSGLWFPWVFNAADAAISVGVALLVLDSLLASAKPRN